MWFLLSLGALLAWSGSDLFTKMGSNPNNKRSHLKAIVAVGVIMGIMALIEILTTDVVVTWDVFVAYLPASILYIVSMALGYVGLRYIELSISSPICNCSGGLVTLLCCIFLQAELGALDIAGVVAIILGVVLLAITEMNEDEQSRLLRQDKANVKYTKSFIALLFPLLYCFLDAAGTFADAIILETLDEAAANISYELTFFAVAVVALIILIVKKEKLIVKTDKHFAFGGICETAGQFAYVYALAARPELAAPIISCYCAVSVLWSRIFLKEKLTKKHYISIAIAFLGILLLGISEGLAELA